jgi:hypothetical protein
LAVAGTLRTLIRRGLACVVLLCCLLGTASAQFGRGSRVPPKYPTADTFGHGFVFCRGIYTVGRRERGGSGWSTDYPDAERNFSIRLAELTKTRVKFTDRGEPDYVTVPLTDDWLFSCPYLHLEDVGTASLSPPEVSALQRYLQKGGFIWVDDFWGSVAWSNWVMQIAQVLPPADYPIRDLSIDHPLFRAQFVIDELPQIPSIQHWGSYGGTTSERGTDSETPHVRAISDRHGNIMVLMTHNTDISDAWEREGDDPSYFYRFSPRGYAVGINAMLYAMSH